MRNEFVTGASDVNRNGSSAITELLKGLVATSVDVSPASKGELGSIAKQLAAQNAYFSNRIAQEEITNIQQEAEIQQLIKQVNSLTPVRTLQMHVKSCAGCTQPRNSQFYCLKGHYVITHISNRVDSMAPMDLRDRQAQPATLALKVETIPLTCWLIPIIFQPSTTNADNKASAPPTLQNVLLPCTQNEGRKETMNIIQPLMVLQM